MRENKSDFSSGVNAEKSTLYLYKDIKTSLLSKVLGLAEPVLTV